MASRAFDLHAVSRGTRPFLAAASIAAACLAASACGPGTPRGKPPTKAEMVASVQEQVKVRAAAMRARPAAAAKEVGMLAESLAPLAEKVGPPFDGMLGAVKEMQTALGGAATPKAVVEAAKSLEERAAALAP